MIPHNNIKDYCFIPNTKIVDFCKREKIPNICFPKGIKEKYTLISFPLVFWSRADPKQANAGSRSRCRGVEVSSSVSSMRLEHQIPRLYITNVRVKRGTALCDLGEIFPLNIARPYRYSESRFGTPF